MPYRMDTGNRVDLLVNATIELIGSDGIEAFTIRRVAAVARLSPASVSSHLETKQRMTELFTQRIAAWLDRELRYRVRCHGTPGLMPDEEVLPLVRAWLAMCELARGNDRLAEVVAAREEDLQDLVRWGFGLDHEDVVTCQMLHALTVGLWTSMCARRDATPVELALTILRNTCARMGLAFDEAA